MPNVNDINGVTIANLSKLDGVLKANIAKILGLDVTAAAALLLDTYTGAAAAYSTRKLKTGVTVAARIRRSGDDIEADVEFDSNNEISLTSPISNASSGTYTDLADFVDHSTTPRDAFVDEWKDQSGSGNHATQSTLGEQPKLYDATTGLITENGKPALQLGRDPIKQLTTSAISWSTSFTAATVLQPTDDGNFYIKNWSIGADATARGYAHISMTGQTAIDWQGDDSAMFGDGYASTSLPRIITTGSAFTSGSQALSFLSLNSTAATLHVDGTEPTYRVQQTGNTSSDSDILYINGGTSASQGMDGTMQELILWPSNESSNRTGIETNINSEYLIYQPTDAPTSGLLATYTGAAAAYSVRQLSDKAVIALRIRRDSDDEERNIGWDANGDLDTTAISDFCGTANGYVTRWWDQSTAGNHADQATDTSQPQIYNGTAVITSGTTTVRPSLQFETSATVPTANTGFNLSFASTLSQPFTASITTRDITTGTDEMCWMDNGNTTGLNGVAIFSNGSPDTLGMTAGSAINSTAQKDSDMLLFGVFNTTNSELFKNNSSIASGNAGSNSLNGLTIGGLRPGINTRFGIHGNVQEWILWDTAQGSTNRTGIHSDTNTYFGIY